MKVLYRLSIAVSTALFCLVAPIVAHAATTPSLGMADTFAILAGTFTNTNPTIINGDVGYTTPPVSMPTINGTNYGSGVPTPQARIDAGAALTTLAANSCTENLGAIVNLSTVTGHTTGVYTPGVYCSTGAMSVGTGGITLSGAGTYIFRADGALTSVDNSVVTLANSASSCDVFWTATAATTLGANTTFVGTVIDNANAITAGAGTIWTGRALSLGAGTITSDTNTITRACSIAAATPALPDTGSGANFGTVNVVKVVVNDGGGTKTVADFPLFVNGLLVISGQTNNFPAPAGVYTVTETSSSLYTRTFSGDCNASGQFNLNKGNSVFCIVTNNDIAAPLVPIVPPLIDVVKTASPLSLPLGPGPVTYTYTVRNIGTVPMIDVTMVGDTCSPIVLVSGDTNGDAKLDVNETWVYTCSTTLLATHTNTVVATGWANGISAVDIASANVVVGLPIVPPLIHVTKIPSPLALSSGGGTVTYTNKVTNPGVVALSNVSLQDDKCGTANYFSGDTNGDSKLDTTETWTFTCTQNLTKTTVNTVVATGEANGLTARDFAIATVVVATVVPKLPNTGFAPTYIALLVGIFTLVSISLFAILRKRTI